MLKHKEKECGKSKIAAKKAVITSALTRSALPIPLTLVPAFCWKLIELLRFAPKTRTGILTADVLITAISLTVSLPLAIAIFTQELKIHREKLEPEFKALNDENGMPITEFAFNKGL